MKKSINQSKGFTLIEVVASLGILSIALLSILSAINVSVQSSNRSSFNIEATLTLQRIVEDEKLKGYDITAVAPNTKVPFHTSFDLLYEINIVDSNANEKWVEKEIAVSWIRYRSGGNTKKQELVTRLFIL